MAAWKWSHTKEQAALLLAEDRLTAKEIAGQLGISDRTLRKWNEENDFRARVAEHVAEFRRRVERQGIGRVDRRVSALQDRWERMQRVIEERAAAEEMQGVPGGSTGLLTRTVKGLGRGEDFQVVEEYAVDTGLLAELRAHERQAAEELGQWKERAEVDVNDRRAAESLAEKLGELAARLGGDAGEAAGGGAGSVPGGPEP